VTMKEYCMMGFRLVSELQQPRRVFPEALRAVEHSVGVGKACVVTKERHVRDPHILVPLAEKINELLKQDAHAVDLDLCRQQRALKVDAAQQERLRRRARQQLAIFYVALVQDAHGVNRTSY
jgi:hypothetical protein